MMTLRDNQQITTSLRRVALWERVDKQVAWVMQTVVIGVLLLSAGAQAAYKPVDISDIQGEQKKALENLWTELKRIPIMTRECFICEQLGLMFSKDYSRVFRTIEGHPATGNADNAYFVGRGGKLICWSDAANAAHGKWSRYYDAAWHFKAEAPLVPFKKEVQKVVCNTARYLLKTMPKEHRWLILALMGNMVYNSQGPFNRERDNWQLDWEVQDGITIKAPHNEARGCNFVDPDGKERDISTLLANGDDWRWRHVVWRCENLVGSRDILALFPEEVEAMRKHYKERIAKVKDEAKAKNDALLVAADEAMSSLPKEKRLARIALAMGLYYLDHKDAGCANGHLNPNATIILPDGSEHSGEEFVDEAPGLLQQVPHEAILGYYRQPIEQMARAVAKERFGEMPPMLRDLLRAHLSRKLIKLDGSPVKLEEGSSTVQTFDRTWQVPMDAVDWEHTYFLNSAGQKFPCSTYNTYEQEYLQTLRLVHLCAQILGKEETVNLIPIGGGATLPAEQRYAWLAEKMGFCFTEDGAPAYQSERTASENAVYVDAQGKVCKLTDAPGKDSPGWTEATSTACAVGYDKFTAPYTKEIRELAVQTSKYILTSMPPGLRQSWLAEKNKLFFRPNARVSRSRDTTTLESGIRYSGLVSSYWECLYYDPSGKIVPTTQYSWEEWCKRWLLLDYCRSVAGIDAINESFSADVKAMRTAYKKSPFYKK